MEPGQGVQRDPLVAGQLLRGLARHAAHALHQPEHRQRRLAAARCGRPRVRLTPRRPRPEAAQADYRAGPRHYGAAAQRHEHQRPRLGRVDDRPCVRGSSRPRHPRRQHARYAA